MNVAVDVASVAAFVTVCQVLTDERRQNMRQQKNRLEFPFNQFWQIESVLYVVCYDSTVACLGSRLESK